MAPGTGSKPKPKDKKQKRQRKHDSVDNVVKLVTRGKLSGQFPEPRFRKLSPLARVPLRDLICEGLWKAGHVFLGFIKSGRYILSYNKVYVEDDDDEGATGDSGSDSDSTAPGYNYTLYWWEFNLHSKLKLVQRVKLFAHGHDFDAGDHDLHLHVCEWPGDDSHIAIFGLDTSITGADRLAISLQNNNVRGCHWFVTVAPNPPSKPCSHCSATTARTGSGGKCLEHGYALHGGCEVDCPFPFPFQPALQLKKDKVILLNEGTMLVAWAIYLCPAGEQGQMLYTKRAAPPSGQASSSPSMLPQGSAEGRPPSNGSLASPSSLSPTLPSSQEANPSWIHGYVDYERHHYHLPQPGEEGEDSEHCFLQVTDLKGRHRKLVPGGPRDGQSLCVEGMALEVGHLLSVLLQGDAIWDPQSRPSDFDFVILEVCPETDKVLIGIGLFLKYEERNMQVSWDLSTGLCSVIGVSDLTNDVPFLRKNSRTVMSHRKSCVDTVMECSVPESSSHHVNVINADGDLEKGVLADTVRCTWVTTA